MEETDLQHSRGLEPIPRTEFPVRCPRPLSGRGGRVPRYHLRSRPTGEPWEVVFLPSRREPYMREGVPESVRVDVVDAGFPATSLDHLVNATIREWPFRAEPQPRFFGVLVKAARSDVTVEILTGSRCCSSN
jgi:hypothetical protein